MCLTDKAAEQLALSWPKLNSFFRFYHYGKSPKNTEFFVCIKSKKSICKKMWQNQTLKNRWLSYLTLHNLKRILSTWWFPNLLSEATQPICKFEFAWQEQALCPSWLCNGPGDFCQSLTESGWGPHCQILPKMHLPKTGDFSISIAAGQAGGQQQSPAQFGKSPPEYNSARESSR